jgi:hypothetical protein
METDREVLMWFHERLEHVHGESHLFDYMHRLRHIIAATPKEAVNRTAGGAMNCFDDLQRYLKAKDSHRKRP